MTRRRGGDKRYKINSGILLMIPLFLVSFFVFSSCGIINHYTVFVVLAPINKEQLNLAINFVQDAEYDLQVKDTTYEIKGICNKKLEYVDTLTSSKYGSAKFKKSINWLRVNQTCDSSGSSAKESLKSVINLINDYLNQHQDQYLIAFIQVPWEKAFSKTDYDELESEVNKIKDKTRVRKIYLFGVTDGKISDIFHVFNDESNKTNTSNVTQTQRVFTDSINPGEVRKKILEAKQFMRNAK